MITKNINFQAKAKTMNLYRISLFCLVFIFMSEIISFWLTFNTNIKNVNIANIKNEFGFNVLVSNFLVIIIAPIVEELTFRYSINGFIKNLNLKLYSLIALVIAVIVAGLSITNVIDKKQLFDSLFKNLNASKSLDQSNYIFFLQCLIPILIFVFAFLFFKFFDLSPSKLIESSNNIINQVPLTFYVISTITWISWHYQTANFNQKSWGDWLFLGNLILASYVFIIFSKLFSIKAAILVHMLHNAFITIISLFLKVNDFKYSYSILLSVFILYIIYRLNEEIQRYQLSES